MVFESNSYITGWQNQVAVPCREPHREGGPSWLVLIDESDVSDRVCCDSPLFTRTSDTTALLTKRAASAIAFPCMYRRRVKPSRRKNGNSFSDCAHPLRCSVG